MRTYLHGGKRRVAVDEARCVEMLEELAAAADVVVCEAQSADELDALGFDAWSAPYKVAITPFGRTGPKRNWHATPNVLQALGGYTNVLGDPNRQPLSLPGHYLEFQSGTLAFTSAMACLHAQLAQAVDIGMLEVLMSLSQFTTVRWHCAGEIRTRHGSDFYYVVPSELFRCSDGWIYVNIVPAFWDAFTVFIDRPELLVDERFADNDRRMRHREALHAIIAAAVVDRPLDELEAAAEACRVPVGIVLSLDAVLALPHLAQRQFWQEVCDNGEWRVPGLPFRFEHEARPSLAVNGVESG